MSAPRVAFATLGCRLNQVESQELQAALEARGFVTAGGDEPADVVVVNTCTVTTRAELSDRQALHRARRRHPSARIVVTGCWAQTDPAAVAALAGVDLVVGNADKGRLPGLVAELVGRPARPAWPSVHVSAPGVPAAGAGPAPPAPLPARPSGRSRAFVKVQDGCQHRCAFCIVPRARGPSRSRPPGVVAEQVRGLVEAGHPEVVLTGVDLGHYGADLTPRTTLAALLRSLEAVPGLRWIRLSSLLPAYFTPELLEVVTASPVIAPHLHLPLQSGSDRVLRTMRRPYTTAMYRRLVERLAAAIPGLGLGTDLIAGFPGESAEDFAATVALVESLPLGYLHVFPYSDRPGTEAARRPDRLPAAVVTARSRRLRELGRGRQRRFRQSLVGTVQEALVLETRDRAGGGLVGLTGNYVEVVFPGPDTLMGRLVRVRIAGPGEERAVGALA